MRYLLIASIFLLFLPPLLAQETHMTREDFLNVDLSLPQNSTKTAVILSAIVPGAGQFYIDHTQWTAYLFPVIEIGLFYTLFKYHKMGTDKEREYERFADAHYDRLRQNTVQDDLVASLIRNSPGWLFYVGDNGDHPENHYNGGHFRLDVENTQHFYEDIAKYDKYVFGWDDWYAAYYQPNGTVAWQFDDDGKYTNNSDSANRAKYIQMRIKAEDYYATSRSMRFYLLANHLVAAVDAYRVARKHNTTPKKLANTPQVSPTFHAVVSGDVIVPTIGFTMKF